MAQRGPRQLGFEYEEVDYVRYSGSKSVALMRSILGYLTWPLVLPLVLLAKTSTYMFGARRSMFAPNWKSRPRSG